MHRFGTESTPYGAVFVVGNGLDRYESINTQRVFSDSRKGCPYTVAFQMRE